MVPSDIARWHAHFSEWPPSGVVDYLLVASKAPDKGAMEAIRASFPGPVRWMGGKVGDTKRRS